MGTTLPAQAREYLEETERLPTATRIMLGELERAMPILLPEESAACRAIVTDLALKMQTAIDASVRAISRWSRQEMSDAELVSVLFEPTRLAEATWDAVWKMEADLR